MIYLLKLIESAETRLQKMQALKIIVITNLLSLDDLIIPKKIAFHFMKQ